MEDEHNEESKNPEMTEHLMITWAVICRPICQVTGIPLGSQFLLQKLQSHSSYIS